MPAETLAARASASRGPRPPARGLDAQRVGDDGRRVALGLAVADGLDDDGDLAEPEQVLDAERPLAVTQPDAVEACAVGAAQVADAPAALGGPDLGVIAADGVVVEDHLEGLEPADADQVVRFPGSTLERAVHAAQAYGPLHVTSLAGSLRCWP